MNRIALAALAATLLTGSAILAEPPVPTLAPATPPPTMAPVADPAQVQPPADLPANLWFYQQELQRYDDPRLAVRRKAQFRTAQRQKRLAAQRWFGFSNQRPLASTTPFMWTYSPYWASNTLDPFAWAGTGTPATAVRVEHVEITR